MSLPQKLDIDMMQNTWAAALNPLLNNPLSKAIILKDVVLTTGSNTINHRLGRKLQGWYIVRMRDTFSQVYDTQDSNQTPQLTLTLNSSANVTADIVVF